jgi:[acyl-carrier-protein] S-malonyltransferase
VLRSDGVEPSAAAGHSLGEFAALVAAGVLDLPSALGAVVERGRAMQRASEDRPGAMTALIGAGPADAAAICDEARGGDVLAVANENASNQVVLSGSPPAIERAEALAAERGARAIRLRVAGAFHSPLMEPAVEPIRSALAGLAFEPPRIGVVANVTGSFVEDAEQERDLLARHVVSPVRWSASMRALAEAGFDTFVEAGPGQVLSKLVRRDMPGIRAVAVGAPSDAANLAASLGGQEGTRGDSR